MKVIMGSCKNKTRQNPAQNRTVRRNLSLTELTEVVRVDEHLQNTKSSSREVQQHVSDRPALCTLPPEIHVRLRQAWHYCYCALPHLTAEVSVGFDAHKHVSFD